MIESSERRGHTRHASMASVEVFAKERFRELAALGDVSEGGLAFRNETPLEVGRLLKIAIPVVLPPFEADCEVRWCRANGDGGYEIGVQFSDAEALFRMRMVEQMCYIKEYHDLCHERGREVSFEEAADEWIKYYAEEFARKQS